MIEYVWREALNMDKKFLVIGVLILFALVLCSCKADTNGLLDENGDSGNKTIFDIKEENNKQDECDDSTQSDETISKSDNLKTSGDSELVESGELEIDVVPVNSSSLSNTTCAWGFRRMKDEVQPEFSASYTKPLDEYGGIYVGNKDSRVIYLTFDEGYENGYTSTILDTLKEKDVEAVFFVTMPYVKQNPDLVRRMIDEGHIVGNHTVNHPSMPSVSDDEKLKKEVTVLHDYVLENFDYEMKYIRPPKGEYSERTVKLCKDIGYTHVLWSFAYDDWDVKKQDRLDYARKMIYNNLHNGCVMLLHAVSKDNDALLGEFIDTARDRGFEFCSLDDFEY